MYVAKWCCTQCAAVAVEVPPCFSGVRTRGAEDSQESQDLSLSQFGLGSMGPSTPSQAWDLKVAVGTQPCLLASYLSTHQGTLLYCQPLSKIVCCRQPCRLACHCLCSHRPCSTRAGGGHWQLSGRACRAGPAQQGSR